MNSGVVPEVTRQAVGLPFLVLFLTLVLGGLVMQGSVLMTNEQREPLLDSKKSFARVICYVTAVLRSLQVRKPSKLAMAFRGNTNGLPTCWYPLRQVIVHPMPLVISAGRVRVCGLDLFHHLTVDASHCQRHKISDYCPLLQLVAPFAQSRG